MNALFSRLHLVLAAHCAINVGISFPDWNPNALALGTRLRLHGKGGDLEKIMQRKWAAGLQDHVAIRCNHGGSRWRQPPCSEAGPGKKQSRTRAATADAPEKRQRRGRARDHTRQHGKATKIALSSPDQPKHRATVSPFHRTSAAPGRGCRRKVWQLWAQPDSDRTLVLARCEEWGKGIGAYAVSPARQQETLKRP